MSRLVLIAVVLFAVLATALAQAAVPAADCKAWVRHLIPLPKQLDFEGATSVAPADVSVVSRFDATCDVAEEAAKLLREALGQTGPVTKPSFTITLALCDKSGKVQGRFVAGAEQLAKLPNWEQAYVIVPGKNALTVAALDERGLYYGALTLSQLLPVKKVADKLTIPLVRVLDWPDLAERGEWGGNCASDIKWMSSVKMNLAEVHANLGINDAGLGTAEYQPGLIEEGRLHAFKVVPIIHHLDQHLDILARMPEIAGQGKAAAPGPTVHAICFSQPRATQLVTDWMLALAKLPHVTDVCIWLSEDDVQCECAPCKAAGQFVLETRACVAAWRKALEVNPGLRLRLLLTQGSYKFNDKVLAEAPPEVNISYYDGGRTYDSSRDPMIYPLLEGFAKSGRWLGVYPQITPSWRIVCPWSGPQFMKYRMTEFVDKKLTNLCAYATPHNRLYDFNVTAAAEWSWNAHGRDEREFAAAWATRRGVNDPEKAADWAVMLGPVGWDVYGSGVPYPSFFGQVGDVIRNRGKYTLGKGPFRYFPDEQHIKDDLATCAAATKLAADLGDPWISAETQVITGYLTMLAKARSISELISRATPPSDAERQGLSHDLFALAQAGRLVNEGLTDWEAASLGSKVGGRLSDTREITDSTLATISTALLPFGVRNALAPYLVAEVGQYHSDDFEAQQATTKTIEVTPRVLGSGTYQVRFVHTAGWNAATTRSVSLASAPADHPDQLTEIVADKHHGVIGYEPTDPTYTLNLPAHDEKLKYFIVCAIDGTKSSDKPVDRRGCNGTISFWKVKQPNEEIKELPLLPMSEAERARYGGPKFTTGGVHVGVLQGGYGAEAMLRSLQGAAGVEAQALYVASPQYLKSCQVVIVAQPLAPESFSPQVASALATYVSEGGGLIMTHSAVGYKGLPVVAPEVCAQGLVNFRDSSFKIPVEHPMGKGLPVAQGLRESYYDYITLKPGPAGTVVARGVATSEPVVVCGPSGKGRYVACGLGIGINPADDKDCPLTADEATLLANMVRWAGGQ